MVSSAPEGLETSWLSIPTAYAVGFILVPLRGGVRCLIVRCVTLHCLIVRYVIVGCVTVRCVIVRCVIDGLFAGFCQTAIGLLTLK